ncbi:unnamed protein product [Symbiodinium sp. KB8]|nr:unnamed protein product [Symbiodinium sp. KB8]
MAFANCGTFILAHTSRREELPRTKLPPQDKVAELLAPGIEEPRHAKPRRPQISTFEEAYPGLIPGRESGGLRAMQAQVTQGRRSARPAEATERTVVQEPAEVWRQQLQKDSVPQEALVAASRSEWQRQRRSREDQEMRWRRQLKLQQQGPASEGTATATASVIPAGLRPAKCIGDSFPDGIKLPLFGQDVPDPIWTTLGNAPWLERVRNRPPRPQDESPWLYEDDDSHPLRQKLTLATVRPCGQRSFD